jgi:hypothetical protein
LRDVDYIKQLLETDYPTERSSELPYPNLEEVVHSTSFDYLAGVVDGAAPNGEESREGRPYLWFRYGDKPILSHRFIASVTLGKWVPRECHIDHINHDPSDNSPKNLRITTPRDNAGNRREALVSELADIGDVDRKLKEHVEANLSGHEPILFESEVSKQEPKHRHENLAILRYTGETKPGMYSGTYFGTTFGSWHWYPEGRTPQAHEYVDRLQEL